MIFIAHRGNTVGPNPKRENRMDHILDALNQGFNVEIDVWYKNKQWWLGHDEPTYKTGTSLFSNPKVWLHAKNSEALKKLNEYIIYNFFWQEGDDYTLTSRAHVWCHVGAKLIPHSICVLPEITVNGDIKKCSGVCSDFVKRYAAHL